MDPIKLIILVVMAVAALSSTAEAQAPREQALLDAVDRADAKRGHHAEEPKHGRGRDHAPPGYHRRGRPDHRRGHRPRRHDPWYGRHHRHPRDRRWISEYEARRLAAQHYALGIRSAHFHDGLWTLIGHRHGHGSIRVVLDAFSGQVVGYFPLHPHRGWRW